MAAPSNPLPPSIESTSALFESDVRAQNVKHAGQLHSVETAAPDEQPSRISDRRQLGTPDGQTGFESGVFVP